MNMLNEYVKMVHQQSDIYLIMIALSYFSIEYFVTQSCIDKPNVVL